MLLRIVRFWFRFLCIFFHDTIFSFFFLTVTCSTVLPRSCFSFGALFSGTFFRCNSVLKNFNVNSFIMNSIRMGILYLLVSHSEEHLDWSEFLKRGKSRSNDYSTRTLLSTTEHKHQIDSIYSAENRRKHRIQ